MDKFDFYKGIYERELNRRKDLDSLVNLPLSLLTILISGNMYLLQNTEKPEGLRSISFEHFIFFSISAMIVIGIFYLTRSYNNLFRGFKYETIALAGKIRNFEVFVIEDYNSKVTDTDKIDFENEVIEQYVQLAEKKAIINNKRSLDLYRAKTFAIIALIMTILNSLILTLKYLNNDI
jgi:hypothetical protein